MKELYKAFQPTLTEAGLKRFGILLKHTPPCKLLRGIVHSYLQISTEKPTPYPVIPDGSQAIFISPHGSKTSGAQSRTSNIQIRQPGDYFGIRFYPGALRYFFDLDLFDITDQFVDSQYFPCRKFGELHNNIYRYQHFHERAQICEQWLLQQFKPQPVTKFDQALTLIYQSFGNIKIERLATMVGWSSRHLNRLFRLHTGLNTKTFTQIIRIQHACRKLYTTPDDSLNIALDLGFFDQSHLIKDYQKYLLTSPNLFFHHLKK